MLFYTFIIAHANMLYCF